ncbi:WDGH domain-containing protein [Streptomyces rochei]|uniref:WDGH domain-containing protein n=1 Tax=Streptomyces rochei TaxID=1928 RepID=UPI0037035741
MDSVYRERAHLVAHLAAIYPATIGYHDPEEPDWAVVIIDGPKGQMSWHISPDDMDLFEHVPVSQVNTWDGHSTEVKYDRLRAATAALPPSGR